MNNKYYGFTESWWQSFWRYKICSTKCIKLAVVGSNSHGKSYLLFDIIHAFELLGYKIKELPLSSPYANWNGYFKDISTDNGCVKGTDRYACRQENHYGAILSKGGDQEIDIEFLNIPGEAFNPTLSSIHGFYELKSAIEKTKKGVFEVTEWKSVAGDVKYVVQPSKATLEKNNITLPDNDPKNVEVKNEDWRSEYQDWTHLFAYLRKLQLEPTRTMSISGAQLIRDFFKFQPDSLMQSIHDAWQSISNIPDTISADDFINKKYNKDFYFHMYCLHATDIVVCDKLFSPKGSEPSDAEVNGSNGFVGLVRELKRFLEKNTNKDKPTNVYLAFRGVDMIINEGNIQKLNNKLIEPTPRKTSNVIYSIFLHQLLKNIDDTKNRYVYPSDANLKKWLGSNEIEDADIDNIKLLDLTNVTTLTGNDLKSHISSRMGNATSGFKLLLYSVQRNKMLYDLLESNTLPIAPHVYFTSTPIDEYYRIYTPDADNNYQRFVRKDPETGAITALNVIGHYLSFGTTQLCMDILSQYQIEDVHNRGGGLLLKLFTKFN